MIVSVGSAMSTRIMTLAICVRLHMLRTIRLVCARGSFRSMSFLVIPVITTLSVPISVHRVSSLGSVLPRTTALLRCRTTSVPVIYTPSLAVTVVAGVPLIAISITLFPQRLQPLSSVGLLLCQKRSIVIVRIADDITQEPSIRFRGPIRWSSTESALILLQHLRAALLLV